MIGYYVSGLVHGVLNNCNHQAKVVKRKQKTLLTSNRMYLCMNEGMLIMKKDNGRISKTIVKPYMCFTTGNEKGKADFYFISFSNSILYSFDAHDIAYYLSEVASSEDFLFFVTSLSRYMSSLLTHISILQETRTANKIKAFEDYLEEDEEIDCLSVKESCELMNVSRTMYYQANGRNDVEK